ncbi:MAG: BamA/TamA family outer membrane protein [Bacteroidota bacterium]
MSALKMEPGYEHENRLRTRKLGRLMVLILIVCLAWSEYTQGQSDSLSADSAYDAHTLILPALGSTPETGLLVGGIVMYQFKPSRADLDTRSSSVLFSAIYTVRKQILLSMLPDIILPNEQWVFNGNYFYNYFPEYYWGIGPLQNDAERRVVFYSQLNIEQNALVQWGPDLFIGPQLRWSRLYNIRFETPGGERVQPPSIAQTNGSAIAGAGVTVRWDRRNSTMTPTQNFFVEIMVNSYAEMLGGETQYGDLEIDTRKYWDVGSEEGRSVIATQFFVQSRWGDPPFWDLATLGGDIIMRGYYMGRYRDWNSAQLQTEWRQRLLGRWGMTLFVSTGEVWQRWNNISLERNKWTVGGGLRFNFNKQDPTNIRLDIGVGPDTFGFYLQFGEAF